jgi:hypothetical protein
MYVGMCLYLLSIDAYRKCLLIICKIYNVVYK